MLVHFEFVQQAGGKMATKITMDITIGESAAFAVKRACSSHSHFIMQLMTTALYRDLNIDSGVSITDIQVNDRAGEISFHLELEGIGALNVLQRAHTAGTLPQQGVVHLLLNYVKENVGVRASNYRLDPSI